jgi:hypothetical protein
LHIPRHRLLSAPARVRPGDDAHPAGVALDAGIDHAAVPPVGGCVGGQGRAARERKGERAEQDDSHRKAPLVD